MRSTAMPDRGAASDDNSVAATYYFLDPSVYEFESRKVLRISMR
jgi:hypothetical protein